LLPGTPLASSSASLSPLLARLRGHAARDAEAVVEWSSEAAGVGRAALAPPLGYAALWKRASALAAALRGGRAALAGEPIAFLLPPGAAFVEVLLGVIAAGGLAVPLSPLHTESELAFVVGNAAPASVIASSHLAARAAAAAPGTRVVEPMDLASRSTFNGYGDGEGDGDGDTHADADADADGDGARQRARGEGGR
jgi:acyl-CoA synthetase (AMP-forming)/AMP-acid ligase II